MSMLLLVLSSVSSVKKRKLLHGPSACTECSIVKSLIEIETLPFAYPRSFLCVTCQWKLLRVKSMVKSLQEMRLYRTTEIAHVTIKQ